jgi:hypothetical protein
MDDDVVVDYLDLFASARLGGRAGKQATACCGDGHTSNSKGCCGRDYVRDCETAFHTITPSVIIS